jgi:hypothetical protein
MHDYCRPDTTRGRFLAGWICAMLIYALFSATTSAFAEGGKSIATATSVTYGQQQFGNTATGAFQPGSCGWGGSEDAYRSFWSLGVLAGDVVTIDWESNTKGNEIRILPMGTTDFTMFQVTPAAEQALAGNGKNQLTYTSPQSGVLPMYFRVCSDTPGPYDFMATDQHALVTALTKRVRIRRTAKLVGTANLVDGTPVPDGLAFTLTAKWPRHGLAQFTGTAQAGSLVFQISLPPTAQGKTVTFAISRVADAQYLEAKSSSQKVQVARRHNRRHRHRH